MSIDWSKAPEGFPIWLEDIRPSRRSGDSEDKSSWAKDGEGEYTLFRVTSGWWAKSREGHDFIAHQKPAQWTGEGLPPVGIEIEAFMMRNMHDTYEWRRAKVVHGGIPGSEREILVLDLESTAPAWVDEFRPIRTPEQIAAQVRSDAIREMIRIWKVAPTGSEYNFAHDHAAQLYDAGYRKQPSP